MRICHVITKPELGGAQLSTLNILSGLPKDKYDISIITSPKGILGPEFKDLSMVRSFFSPFLVRSVNPLYDILALIHIYRIYRRNKYHLIHTHSSKAGILGRLSGWLAGVPTIIHTVHGWSFNDCEPRVLKRFSILLERITARFTTKIICVSRKDLEIGLKYKIAPKEKFTLIKYGIALSEFRKSQKDVLQKRKELGIANNDPVIGMISCLKPQKSPLDYIKACVRIYEKMPNINFLLIGDGILREKCERLLASAPLNGRFIFTGWRRDTSEIMDILDVVVLTSKWEGMPISLIEALSKGCPVVATDVGGVSELVKDGITGYIVKPGSHEDVAMKALKILKDRGSFNKMKEEAMSSIDDSFELDRMVEEIKDLYQRFI
ncbi:glycosyltransferase family 4 protein [Candidatus Omnitrophota bacterium]